MVALRRLDRPRRAASIVRQGVLNKLWRSGLLVRPALVAPVDQRRRAGGPLAGWAALVLSSARSGVCTLQWRAQRELTELGVRSPSCDRRGERRGRRRCCAGLGRATGACSRETSQLRAAGQGWRLRAPPLLVAEPLLDPLCALPSPARAGALPIGDWPRLNLGLLLVAHGAAGVEVAARGHLGPVL